MGGVLHPWNEFDIGTITLLLVVVVVVVVVVVEVVNIEIEYWSTSWALSGFFLSTTELKNPFRTIILQGWCRLSLILTILNMGNLVGKCNLWLVTVYQ